MRRDRSGLASDVALWATGGCAACFLLGLAIALAFAAGEAAETGQRRQLQADPGYQLTLAPDGRSVRLEGAIDFGITRDLAALLDRAAEVSVIRLQSDGGRVAEARGLVKVIERHALDTAADGRCASACALVFLSGRTRHLEPGARLGFHRYGLFSPLVGHFLDPTVEQERDMALFRRQAVDEAFIQRVVRTPHSTMWFPDPDELLAAGVVDVLGRAH